LPVIDRNACGYRFKPCFEFLSSRDDSKHVVAPLEGSFDQDQARFKEEDPGQDRKNQGQHDI
jgi:hypothetical protein